MKTQAFPFILCIAITVIPALSMAGTCKITRMYQTEERIMQHMSRVTIGGEARNDQRSCKRVCEKEAKFLPSKDARKLKSKKEAKKVEVRCSYAQGSSNKSQVIAKYHGTVSQLRAKQEKRRRSSRSSGSRMPSPQATPPTQQKAAQEHPAYSNDPNRSATTPRQVSAPPPANTPGTIQHDSATGRNPFVYPPSPSQLRRQQKEPSYSTQPGSDRPSGLIVPYQPRTY